MKTMAHYFSDTSQYKISSVKKIINVIISLITVAVGTIFVKMLYDLGLYVMKEEWKHWRIQCCEDNLVIYIIIMSVIYIFTEFLPILMALMYTQKLFNCEMDQIPQVDTIEKKNPFMLASQSRIWFTLRLYMHRGIVSKRSIF